MGEPGEFLFATCQVGAEGALKQELAREWPDFHLAFSRPGFLTFKLPAGHGLADDFDLRSVFARSYGFSLGRVTGEDADAMARQVWQRWDGHEVRRIHVWARDTAPPGESPSDPALEDAVRAATEAIRRHCPDPEGLGSDWANRRRPARRGDPVLDCTLVEPHEWWVGRHRARSEASRWPGGAIPLELPPDAVSRAWLKMEEALRWSRLPIQSGARCAELGSAPGGSSQALLARGYHVLGIDPAEMDPAVLGHPRFTHLRRRSTQVRRRDFRKIRWLMADMNVAPAYTLQAVESIVTHREVSIRGMLLTLKLTEWQLAENIPQYLERIGGWGYNRVWARQLVHNGQEICVAALQKPFRRKPPSTRR